MTTQIPLQTQISGGSSALLQALETATEQTLTNLAAPKTGAQELEEKIQLMQQQIEETGKITDQRLRDDRMRILTSTLESLRKEDEAERRDFADAVMGLDVLMNSIGGDFDKLMQPSAAEQAVLSSAKSEVQAAESQLAEAGQKIQLFGFRDRAVKAATTQLEQAKIQQTEAEQRVKKMARERLQSADIEESMQQYKVMVDRTIKIMQARHKTTAAQLKIISARKDEAFKIKNQAAGALERLEQELNGVENDLGAAEEMKGTMINGSPDYVAQEQVVSNLKAKAEEIRGNRNTAHTVLLSKEKYCSELEIHEIATRKTFETQKIWIAKSQSDSEERQVTFVSRVEQMKAMSDFDVIQNQHAVGDQIDASNASYMASSSAAADRARMSMVEGHPEQMRILERIRSAQAESIAQIREREADALANFRARFGIDPFSGSYLHDNGAAGTGDGAETQQTVPA